MNNAELIALAAQKDILNITTHNVPGEHSYKIVRFRSLFNKALRAYDDAREALVKEAGIEDEKKFNDDLDALKAKTKKTDKDKEFLATMQATANKRDEMLTTLLNEPADLSGVKTMPYDAWKALQDENRATDKHPEMLSGVIMVIETMGPDGDMKLRREDTEEVLQDILWVPPTE